MKSLVAIAAMLIIGVAGAADKTAPAAASIRGEVMEAHEAGTYTYLRLKTKDGETWAAVGRAAVKKGAQVTIDDPMVMNNFESKSMKRKFDRIVLGTLAGGGAPAPHGAMGGAGASPHGSVAMPADIGDVKVAKAAGPDARTVAEIVTRRAELKDKSVLLRAKVVKFTGDVLGKNWIHVRDGSGSAADKTDDIVVTTTDLTKVGDVVLLKGIVRTDRDLGSGYSYKVLVEDARLQK